MPKKIYHFRDNCIGCGNCVEYAKDYWELDELDGKANLLFSSEKKGVFSRIVEEIDEEKNKDAADTCPVNIIQIH